MIISMITGFIGMIVLIYVVAKIGLWMNRKCNVHTIIIKKESNENP